MFLLVLLVVLLLFVLIMAFSSYGSFPRRFITSYVLGATGPTGAGSSSSPDEFIFTSDYKMALTGGTGSLLSPIYANAQSRYVVPDVKVFVQKVGNVVTLYGLQSVLSTGSSFMTSLTGLPAGYRPASNSPAEGPVRIQDAADPSAGAYYGLMTIDNADGKIFVFRDPNFAYFDGSPTGNSGFYRGWSMTYSTTDDP